MDIDPAEIGKLRARRRRSDRRSGARDGRAAERPHIAAWRAQCKTLKTEHAWRYDAPGAGVYAPELLRRLSERAGGP